MIGKLTFYPLVSELRLLNSFLADTAARHVRLGDTGEELGKEADEAGIGADGA